MSRRRLSRLTFSIPAEWNKKGTFATGNLNNANQEVARVTKGSGRKLLLPVSKVMMMMRPQELVNVRNVVWKKSGQTNKAYRWLMRGKSMTNFQGLSDQIATFLDTDEKPLGDDLVAYEWRCENDPDQKWITSTVVY
jgi:hypothetical protein